MKGISAQSPTQQCECILRESKEYNLDHDILPDEVTVIERMLSRSVELNPAYDELLNKLGPGLVGLKHFFLQFVTVAAYWTPVRMIEARDDRDMLVTANRQIRELALRLAEQLSIREDLHNRSGFFCNADVSMIELIKRASDSNCLFKHHVLEKLETLQYQYDGKYWPRPADCLRVLAVRASEAEIVATDPMTTAGTQSARPSKSDAIRAILAVIDLLSSHGSFQIPGKFKLTDARFADLVNCALGLVEDDCIDAQYVKRLRQRIREAEASTSIN